MGSAYALWLDKGVPWAVGNLPAGQYSCSLCVDGQPRAARVLHWPAPGPEHRALRATRVEPMQQHQQTNK